MATNYAVRITRAWDIVERAVVALALRCDKVLAYEHVGSATEKVHVHLMLVGVRCDTDTLKNDCKRNGLGMLKGNADWTFKTKDKKYGDVQDSPQYICYMTKGKYDPKYNKGYTQEELDIAKATWVVPSKQKSLWSKWFAEFELMVPKDLPQHSVLGINSAESFPGWSKVRSMAIAFIFEKTGELRRKDRNDAVDMWLTYCYKHHIDMPKGATESRI